jgi:ATP-binding cassette subfamily B protein
VAAGRKHAPSLCERLASQARPYWLHILGILALGLLSTPLALLTPLPLQIAVDSVLDSRPMPRFLEALLPHSVTRSEQALLALAVALTVAIALLSKLEELASALLSTYTGEKLALDFRARLFRHVQRLSLSYHDAKGTSDSTYRIQNDAWAIRYIAIDGVIPFITAGVALLSTLYIILQLDWQLTLVALAVSPILILVSRAYRRHFRTQSREIKQLESSVLSVIQEVLAALRVVKAFGQEDREEERFVDRSGDGMRARLRFVLVENSFSLLIGLTTAVGTAAVLFIGISHVQSGVLTLGQLLLVMSYLAQLYTPLRTIGRKVGSLQSHLASAERAFTLLDEAPDVTERPNARPLVRAAGAVTFRNVSFAYDRDRMVLDKLSFEIGARMRVGIAGTTGAGKTTLVSLLMRFYDPIDGQILLDGIDLRAYRLADLRNQFGVVLQEPVLFSTSIAENIAYARPGAGDDAIIAAAKAANAHEFISRLPRGYATQVGERGLQLSGGERQRIALARAFLKDAPILILDEPTSSVDVTTEAAIMMALEQLMRDRTTFIIAHRVGTLAFCDLRLEMENGRLVDAGGPPIPDARPVLSRAGATLRKERIDG